MPVAPEVVAGAKKLRADAVNELLHAQAARVYRLAYALSGRWDVGRGIARFVLNRSVKLMPKWEVDDDPANWFNRFTIMTSRRSARHQPASPQKDVLVEQALQPDNQYIAFIAALRHLEKQQREAFLLRHGEHLNARYSAVAMDCSTQAAETHLGAAEQAIKLVAADHFDALVKKMSDAYAHLTPEPDQLVPAVSHVVFRQVRVRRLVRRIVILISLIALAAIACGGWWLYRHVQT
jgi:DNA-directed RNA polymerase specialized sigma24 family protein